MVLKKSFGKNLKVCQWPCIAMFLLVVFHPRGRFVNLYIIGNKTRKFVEGHSPLGEFARVKGTIRVPVFKTLLPGKLPYQVKEF